MANAHDFGIFFQNDSDSEIKVLRVSYRLPDGSWKTEHMLGVDGHQKLDPHKCLGGRRTLEQVEGEVTEFEVQFNEHLGGAVWGDRYVVYSGEYTVRDSGSITIYLDPRTAKHWTIFDRVSIFD
jgi:hypothetical protein